MSAPVTVGELRHAVTMMIKEKFAGRPLHNHTARIAFERVANTLPPPAERFTIEAFWKLMEGPDYEVTYRSGQWKSMRIGRAYKHGAAIKLTVRNIETRVEVTIMGDGTTLIGEDHQRFTLQEGAEALGMVIR